MDEDMSGIGEGASAKASEASKVVALPQEGSEEFELRCKEVLAAVVAKYAWTAQQEGIVYRRNPLKLPPYKDYIYNRVVKSEFGFWYIDRTSRKRLWYPSFDLVMAEAIDGDGRDGFVIAERIEFMPGKPELTHDADGCRVLNLWRAPRWKADVGSPRPSLFLDHLAYLLNGDEAEVNHVLDYVAHLVQKPHERVGHAILITSEAKGIGKSTLGRVLRRLVGEQNARVAQTKDLKGQFDGWLVGNLVIQVDEVYEAGNWDLANKLKPLITEPTVSVNMKYGPQMEVENYARFIMFSNHTAPLNIEDGDRRYFVVNSQAQPREDSYYDALNKYIDSDPGMNEIYSFFCDRNIEGFSPYRRPPLTAAKEAIVGLSGNPLHSYILDALKSGHLYDSLGAEFSMDALIRLLHRDGFGVMAKNQKELAAALDGAGIVSQRKTVDGQRRRVRILPVRERGDEEALF